MGADAVFKRFFPVVVLALLGVAAYFQAVGIGQILAAGAASTSVPAATMRSPPSLLPPRTHPAEDALAILSRNPFDSTTGPLDGQGKVPPPDKGNDSAPDCGAARVLLITWSEDPLWSFASIATGDGKSELRRVGDEVNGYKLDEIEWDRVRMTSSDGKRCEAAIGAKITASAERPPPPPIKANSRIPEDIASRIHRIDATHFAVERPVLNDILLKQAELLGRARALPEKDGVKLLGIQPGSMLEFLGVENGDILQSINGIDVSNTAELLKSYQGFLTAEHLTVSMSRRGKPMSVDFTVK
jgi:general secretion pathway protein C